MTRTYHKNPQVEVFVGGYPSNCTSNDACDFQWLTSQTPSVTSITQNGMVLTIAGTGFSAAQSENTITIGTEGSCTASSASTVSLTCTVAAAPSGVYTVQIYVANKGIATGTSTLTVTIPLQITSFVPTEGGAGQ